MEPAVSPSRRRVLALAGGGLVAAAAGAAVLRALRRPVTAARPWAEAGLDPEPRRRALSVALLAPNPHNRQPWLVDLREADTVTLFADPARLLPVTDPQNRQITIGLGGFLELMTMAAAEFGHRVTLDLFPDGEDPAGLDHRPIARARFAADPAVARDPLFAQVPLRRSLKEPFDTARPLPAALLDDLRAAAGAGFGGSVDNASIAALRQLTRDALVAEITTPAAFQESVDLFRIGAREVDANPDGIDFTGPLFESLAALGLFTRASASDPQSLAYQAGLDAVLANADTAMGHVWLVTPGNSRRDQIAAGAAWLRLNLAATALGLGLQPLSQALQEYPEVAAFRAQVQARLAPQGGTVQMLGRIGYGPATPPSPRWPLETRIMHG
jgi:hypothetical protein